MYIPPSFLETDQAFIMTFLQEHGFAALVSTSGGRPVATHLLLEPRKLDDSRLILSGHMSRENPQWKTFDPASEILAIFQGPHSYVSASWYSVQSAPTWNYLSVHAYGLPRIVEERSELYALLKRLVDSQEGERPVSGRYTIESLPGNLLDGMMNGIVGFEVTVTRMEAAAKMSQNRSARDYQNIIDELKAREDPGSRSVATEMERRKKGATER
jgi:transcriptional regulator